MNIAPADAGDFAVCAGQRYQSGGVGADVKRGLFVVVVVKLRQGAANGVDRLQQVQPEVFAVSVYRFRDGRAAALGFGLFGPVSV